MSEIQLVRPDISENEVKIFLEELYGLKVKEIKELNGYDDKNYKITTENKHSLKKCDCFVFKISNTLDSLNLSFMEAVIEVMLLIDKNDIKCPKPVKNLKGGYFSLETLKSGQHVFRLFEYIHGNVLLNVTSTNTTYFELGQLAARVDVILKDYSHKAYDNRKSIWNLESVPEVLNFVYVIDDKKRNDLVKTIISLFQNNVLNNIDRLEKGFIHGDMNESNLIANQDEKNDWHVSAILDFGDSSISCYLFELAIAMTYMILLNEDLEAGGYVLAGYTSVKHVGNYEKSLLKICILARLCQSLVLGAYTARKDPGNAYVLTTQKNGWEVLEKLWNTPDNVIIDSWNNIVENVKNI